MLLWTYKSNMLPKHVCLLAKQRVAFGKQCLFFNLQYQHFALKVYSFNWLAKQIGKQLYTMTLLAFHNYDTQ